MENLQRNIIIGTSGHIDHGKSAIVNVLTGTNPDRLKEEQERGLTIDLGYAFYNEHVAFVDVPGHERFIKNMVAGVTSIDFVLFVLAADDGVMPQTHEHLDILDLLGVERGIIVINKIDLAEPDWIDMVEEEVRELTRGTFLDSAPVVRFSALNKSGLEELKIQIELMVQTPTKKIDRGYFWMPVDRSFTIQGFGTVVTGSINSGKLTQGETIKILPSGKTFKVRGLQKHGSQSNSIEIGDRGAINLLGAHREDVQRGDVIVTPGCGIPVKRFDAELKLLKNSPWELKDQARVRLHVGTSEIFARIRLLDHKQLIPEDQGFVQFILEKPIATNRNDRFVIRKYSPSITIGGGFVLDNDPLTRHKRFNDSVIQHFKNLASNDVKNVILEMLTWNRNVKSFQELVPAIGMSTEKLQPHLEESVKNGSIRILESGDQRYYIAKSEFEKSKKNLFEILTQFHNSNPHLPGMSRAELASRALLNKEAILIESILKELSFEGEIVFDNEIVSLAEFSAGLNADQQSLYNDIIKLLQESSFTPPTIKELYEKYNNRKSEIDLVINYSRKRKEIVVLQNGLVYLNSTLNSVKKLIVDWIKTQDSITAGELRNIIQASRKFAIALLEYFDEKGLTYRDGDQRYLNI